MNLKNLTIALTSALFYEIIFKLSRNFASFIFEIPLVSSFTKLLSFVVGLVIILFLFYFNQEEKDGGTIELILKVIIGLFILHFIVRHLLPFRITDFKTFRYFREILGFVQAILFFILLIIYKRKIPARAKSLVQATTLLTVLFGITILKSFYALVTFTRFILFGTIIQHPIAFYNILFVLFVLTHLSIIYFLYCYYGYKFSPNKTAHEI